MNGKATVKLSGKRFVRTSCARTKTAARATAEAIRKRGGTARVIKAATGEYCVFKGPKAKPAFGGTKRKKATTATTKRKTTKRRAA